MDGQTTGEGKTRGDTSVPAGARIAVTGGSGTVGQTVIRHLLGAGYEVVNIDRMPPQPSWSEVLGRVRAAERGEAFPGPSGDLPEASLARFACCDLRDRPTLQPILEGCAAVCHLGEIPNEQQPFPHEQIFANNTAAASTVIQVAADLKLSRLVYTSSAQVYGFWGRDWRLPPVVPDRLPMDESQPVSPQNVYSLSKVANESYARLASGRKGLSVAAFRLPHVRGGQSRRAAQWLGRMSGDGRFDEGMGTYADRDDVGRAYVAAMTHVRPGFEVYNVMNATVLTERPIRERLAEFHPDLPPLPADWPDARSPVLLDKIRDHLGWEPHNDLLPAYLEARAASKRERLAEARSLIAEADAGR